MNIFWDHLLHWFVLALIKDDEQGLLCREEDVRDMAGENDHEGDSYNIGVNVLLFVDVVDDTTRQRATEHVDRDDSDGHVDHKT